jgi:hypothetical protein
MKSILEERYNIQFEYLQKELELYLEVAKQKNLTDEDRAMVQAKISAIQIEQTNLATQKRECGAVFSASSTLTLCVTRICDRLLQI